MDAIGRKQSQFLLPVLPELLLIGWRTVFSSSQHEERQIAQCPSLAHLCIRGGRGQKRSALRILILCRRVKRLDELADNGGAFCLCAPC